VANPFPANFEGLDGSRRLTGQVNFTDPANQPGSGGLLTKSLHLSSAQILALGGTPVTAVAAPGVGKALFTPNAGGYAVFTAGTTPYTLGPSSIYVGAGAVAGAAGTGSSPLLFGTSNLLDSAVDAFASMEIAGANGGPLTDIEDQPIQVAAQSSPTLGNGVLDLFFYYVVVDLP
jgi:hypothetical protein